MLIERIAKHLDSCDINVTFTKVDDIITAIIVPKPKNDKLVGLSPIIAKGTAEELDKNLFIALEPVFEAIAGFKITGVAEVTAEIEQASKEVVKPAKVKVEKPAPVVKPNAKADFDAASKLFNEGKYSEALPLYQSASDIKPDSKPYKEAVANCQRWIDSIAKMNVIAEPNIVVLTTEQPRPHPQSLEAILDAEEEHLMEEAKAEIAEEDEDDFPIN